MDIQKLLKEYRENKAKIRLFEYEIEGLEDVIKRDKEEVIYSELDEIEGHVLEAVSLSDMPRGNTNKFHSSTESAAFLPPPEDNANINYRERIKELKSRKYQLERDVKLVENVLLPSLNIKEVFIILRFYFDEYSYKEISIMYSEKFEPKEPDTIRNDKSNIIKYLESLVKISA